MNGYDVLVVGSGPAGSRVAFQLARSGCRVGVLEKQAAVSKRFCCTGIVGRECAERFEIDPGCILQGARSARMYAPSGQSLEVRKAEDQAVILDRQAFDRWLAQRAAEAGAEYHFDCRVTGISRTTGGVQATVSRDGQARQFGARAVVIASGFGPKLTRELGLGRIGRYMVGAQCEVEAKGIEEVEVYFSQWVAPGFFAWAVPIRAQGRARVGLFSYRHPGHYLREFLGQLGAQGRISASAGRISYGAIPLKPLPRTYAERVLVVGDAAGQVKPTTGGGIYYGLLAADIAAGTLTEALAADDLSGRWLSRYETLWKKQLGRELRIDYFARCLYNRLSDRRIEELFTIVRENHIHERMLESSTMSFDWHGEMVLDGLKRLGPWRSLLGRYLPQYIWHSLRRSSSGRASPD